MRSFSSPDTHFRIEVSGSPPSVDGLAIEEPKWMVCDCCGAKVRIDAADETQTAIDNLPHDAGCPQRDTTSRYYMDTFV